MGTSESDEEDRPLNGAILRVVGGILVGIGIGPVVVWAIVTPIAWVFEASGLGAGGATAAIFSGGAHLMLGVAGLVVLHLVRLFYRGNWRSLDPEAGRPRRGRQR